MLYKQKIARYPDPKRQVLVLLERPLLLHLLQPLVEVLLQLGVGGALGQQF